MRTITKYQKTTVPCLHGETVFVLVTEDEDRRRVFTTAEIWCDALRVPQALRVWFNERVIQCAITLETERAGEDFRAEVKGKAVYRWHAVEEAISKFMEKHHDQFWDKRSPPVGKSAEFEFYKRGRALKHWGWDMQELAIANAVGTPTGKPKDTTTILAAVIAEALGPQFDALHTRDNEQEGRIESLGSRVDEFETRVSRVERTRAERDPDEFITTRDRCLELGRDPERLVSGRRNLQECLGQWLKDNNKEVGAKVKQRLSGSGVIVEVNSFRRRDIDCALDQVLGLS